MWPNPQETANLVRFTEEILNGKLHFLYSEICSSSTFQHTDYIEKVSSANLFKSFSFTLSMIKSQRALFKVITTNSFKFSGLFLVYFYIIGICPSRSSRNCLRSQKPCSGDVECPSSQLCCSNGCGQMICQPPGRH